MQIGSDLFEGVALTPQNPVDDSAAGKAPLMSPLQRAGKY